MVSGFRSWAGAYHPSAAQRHVLGFLLPTGVCVWMEQVGTNETKKFWIVYTPKVNSQIFF